MTQHTTMRAVVIVVAAMAVALAKAKMVTFNNLAPRLDSTGTIMDAHDGSIQRFSPDGPYYMHAVAYGLCKEPAAYGCDQTPDRCGFTFDHNISIYVSPDMSSGSWVYLGNAIDIKDRPAGTVYRPHAVYNPNTGEYVLWWNYVTPAGQYNGYAVAVAPTPAGPFRLVNSQVNITRLKGGAGDFDLFVDYDAASQSYKGYVIYGADFYMSIEELTPDFYYSTGKQAACTPSGSPLFAEYFIEAPVMFKRGAIYYALFGHCCCFCYQGSGIIVHTAPSPLGPWTVQPGGDIACVPPSPASVSALPYGGVPTPGQGCLYNNSKDVSITRSQQNFVIEVRTATGTEYVWTGDRWQQAPDGIKGHDPQYWVPLVFNPDGSIREVTWVNSFTLDIV